MQHTNICSPNMRRRKYSLSINVSKPFSPFFHPDPSCVHPISCISSRFVKQGFIAREFSQKLGRPADLIQVSEGSAGDRGMEEHGKEIKNQIAQLHSG